jgi:hypothetical protein
MVNQSDAPFRALCYRHGATCCYSEMLYSDRVVSERLSDGVGYLEAFLPVCDGSFVGDDGGSGSSSDVSECGSSGCSSSSSSSGSGGNSNGSVSGVAQGRVGSYHERHFVVQVCGNDPITLASAATLIVKHCQCSAIDLNLGCPQDRARTGTSLFHGYICVVDTYCIEFFILQVCLVAIC